MANSSNEICNANDISQPNLEKPFSETIDTKSEEKDSTNTTISCILGKETFVF